MNKQEVFNKSVIGVLSQKNFAFNAKTQACVLKSKAGDKCAFGQLIPNESYKRDMEILGALKQTDNLIFSKYPSIAHLRQFANLLADLQKWHDSALMAGNNYCNCLKKTNPISLFIQQKNMNKLKDIARIHNVYLAQVKKYFLDSHGLIVK